MPIKKTPPSYLCATQKAMLSWHDDIPVAKNFDDVYFSKSGGLEESRQVFLRGCNLPQDWQDNDKYIICELGFGTGLNFLAVLDLWQKAAGTDQFLHFISIEKFPLDKKQLMRALEKFDEIKSLSQKLISKWPDRVKGTHRLHFGNVVLDLIHDDIANALDGLNIKANAWFLDGFTPAKNPDMWSENVFSQISRLSAPNAKIGTFTVAGKVKQGLSALGFEVKKQAGFGKKRERLEAVYKNYKQQKKIKPCLKPVIIGGGIAGASIAKAFLRRGIKPVIIDPHPDLQTAASGNPLGLVMPKLDKQDRPESRFYNSAFIYTKNLYDYETRGIIQIAKTKNEEERFEDLAKLQALPPDEMQFFDKEKAQKITDINIQFGGLFFPGAMIINPAKNTHNLVKETQFINSKVAKISNKNNIWQCVDEGGQILAKTNTLFVCNGANIKELIDIGVRFTKGQVCWGEGQSLATSIVTDIYAISENETLLIGASHEHVGAGEDNNISQNETNRLLQKWVEMGGENINKPQARASVRVNTKNTLPLAFEQKQGLYILSGLGSRGFLLAPLLGEYLACQSLGLPIPLDKQTISRFRPKQ